jgi:hypothetical protein
MDSKASILATKEDLVGKVGSISHALGKWKTDLLKWMFFFWATEMAAPFILIWLVLKK